MKRETTILVLALAVCATGGMALAFGAQPVFAQGRSIDPAASAVSLNGRIGQRVTLTCPAINEARNSIYGTDTYTADSPVCQAALHAGVLRPGQAGTVAIEIGAGAREYVGSTRNGVTTRSYGPYSSSYTFVAAETPATLAGVGAALAPTTNISAGNEMPPTLPTTAPAGNGTPPPGAAPVGNGAPDPAVGNAVAKKVLAAVAQAVNTWKSQARLTGEVLGATLAVRPGGLTGPPLAPLIKVQLTGQGVAPETVDKFANVFGEAWQLWLAGFAVQGQPAYPGFAAWPGPQAPPTANVPFSVAAGNSAHLAALSASALRSALLARFPGATPQQKQDIEALSLAAANSFNIWRASTHFTKVMGSGPVPSFAPPAVPVGQVVGGTAMMQPGGLVGPGFPATGIP